MKKAFCVVTYVLFALTIFLPIFKILFACFGCTFEVFSILAFSVAILLFSLTLVILGILHKGEIENRIVRVFLAIITPLSLINAVFYIFLSADFIVALCMLFSSICCSVVAFIYGKPVVLKYVMLVLSGLMILPIAYLSFIILIFGNIAENTVVQTVDSPNGQYYAEVIDNDQGALGGATIVNLRSNHSLDLLLFKIEKKPQQVYYGEWGEYKGMNVYWRDDEWLVVNSHVYRIE